MIVTRRFVFLHLHKSGGTFANQWLLRFIPGAQQVGYHLPRKLIPHEYSELPVLGLVRNPWSYYVSWYAFQSGLARPNALFQILTEGRRLGFEGTIRNMLQLGSGGPHLDALIAALPQSYGSHGINLPALQLARIRDTGVGFYTFLYRYMYGGNGPPVALARMEALGDELPELIRQTGTIVDKAAAEALVQKPPVNTSAHAHYSEYYDPELRDLIAEGDSEVIHKHGYRFVE